MYNLRSCAQFPAQTLLWQGNRVDGLTGHAAICGYQQRQNSCDVLGRALVAPIQRVPARRTHPRRHRARRACTCMLSQQAERNYVVLLLNHHILRSESSGRAIDKAATALTARSVGFDSAVRRGTAVACGPSSRPGSGAHSVIGILYPHRWQGIGTVLRLSAQALRSLLPGPIGAPNVRVTPQVHHEFSALAKTYFVLHSGAAGTFGIVTG